MNKQYKVLHIIPAYGGGISSFVKNLALGSKDTILINDVVGFSDYPIDYINVISGQNGKCFTLCNFYRHPVLFLYRYITIIRKGHYDAIHCHISGLKGFVFKFIAHILGISQTFTHAHRSSDEYDGLWRSVRQTFTIWFSNLLSTEKYSCSQMASDFIFGQNAKSVFLPNSINLDKWLLNERASLNKKYRKEFSISDNTLVIGHVGRFNKQKNHSFILRLVLEMKAMEKDFVCILCGDGELFPEIKNKTEELGLCENIRYIGYRNDINYVASCFDQFILPSLYEGLPTVAVEMQAAGIPCILSNTITHEVDMGISLLVYLPLDIKIWIKYICSENKKHINDTTLIKNALINKGFTPFKLNNMYIESLNKKINNDLF